MIQTAIIIAFVVRFIHECTREGMIFGFVSFWLYDLPKKLKKPLYDCPTCMCPWWGSLIIWVSYMFGYCQVENAFEFVMVLFMAGGINAVILSMSSAVKEKCNCGKSKFDGLT